MYFFHANPAGIQSVKEHLSEGGASDVAMVTIECRGKRYPCLQVSGANVELVKRIIESSDVFTSVRLFTRRDSSAKSVHEVTFMLGKSSRFRKGATKH